MLSASDSGATSSAYMYQEDPSMSLKAVHQQRLQPLDEVDEREEEMGEDNGGDQ